MKTLLTTFVVLACFGSGGLSSAHSAAPDDRRSGKDRPELSPEIRQQFQKARAEALQDPEIRKLQSEARDANQNFFKAIRKKMLEIDPSLKEVVHKMRAGKMGKKGRPDRRKAGQSNKKAKPSRPESGMGSLSDEEKAKLKNVRASALKDPAVQAAMAAKESAKTPEERRAASESFRKAMHAAMLKIDPAMEPLLKKLGPQSRKKGGWKKKAKAPAADEMMMDQ